MDARYFMSGIVPADLPVFMVDRKSLHKTVKDRGGSDHQAEEPGTDKTRGDQQIYWQKERATNIFQVKRRPGKIIENVSVFYKKQPTYNPQMVKYDGPKRTNKVKNGKLGILVDSGNRKPYEYQDKGVRYPLQIVQFKRDILSSNLHPTQKPLELMKYLVNTYTNEGDTVLDFTMGSGTTGLACVLLNRNFIGIELNKEYFDIAENRISSATKNQDS